MSVLNWVNLLVYFGVGFFTLEGAVGVVHNNDEQLLELGANFALLGFSWVSFHLTLNISGTYIKYIGE